MTAPKRTQRTMLGAVAKAATAQRKAVTDRDHLIAVAVHYGCSQTAVAKAASMSQAHVSRIYAHFRKLAGERKQQAATRRKREGGKV